MLISLSIFEDILIIKLEYLFRLISKSLLNGLIVLVSIIAIVSSLIFISPIDPVRLTFGQRLDESTLLEKRKELGLDLPLHHQIINYLGELSPVIISDSKYETEIISLPLAADYGLIVKYPSMGESYQSGKSTIQLILGALPNTVILAFASFVIACILGIAFGLIAGIKHNSLFDRSIVMFSTFGISLPSYVTAMVLALIFAQILNSYTGLNIQGSLFTIDDLGNDVVVWKNLILPALALGVRPISIITQITRSVVIDVLSMNYIKTAKAKGLNYFSVVKRHVLRNAGNPILTTVSGWFASLLAGSFFVEFVFNFKGIGLLTINALMLYDIPVLLGCLILICSIFILVNISVDILYKMIDPRINY